ncbi:hypothetical protein SNEBB_010942 [Seison nebaliae]|nr:hypothetical protein SNEBB_010942 [Seison nebaliae]
MSSCICYELCVDINSMTCFIEAATPWVATYDLSKGDQARAARQNLSVAINNYNPFWDKTKATKDYLGYVKDMSTTDVISEKTKVLECNFFLDNLLRAMYAKFKDEDTYRTYRRIEKFRVKYRKMDCRDYQTYCAKLLKRYDNLMDSFKRIESQRRVDLKEEMEWKLSSTYCYDEFRDDKAERRKDWYMRRFRPYLDVPQFD